MTLLLFYSAFAAASALIFIVQHVFEYFRDSKKLRRFPGMTPLAPFTNFSTMYSASCGRKFMAIHEAHQKHGPVIRVGPNSLSFNDAVGFKDIYGHGSPVRKAEFYDLLAGSHRNLVDSADREEHSRKRRVLAAAYSLSGLEHWEHIVADRVAALLDQYDDLCSIPKYHPTLHADSSARWDGFINHRHWMILFAEDAITQIGLSADLKLLEKGHDILNVTDPNGCKHEFTYRYALWRSAMIQTCFVWSPRWFNWLQHITTWHPWWQEGTKYTFMCVDLVQRRLERYQNGEKLNDFFSSIFEDKYGKPNMYPLGEMVAECSIMLNAGSDTTGIALTNVLYWLLRNPDCLDKLRAEIDSVLETDEVVASYEKIKHLSYLRACIDESLRLTPPNTLGVPRLTPLEGMTIMGHWIPGNTTVHSSPYTMHRHADVFPDPEAFKPERWLAADAKDLQPHFIPFSGGSRGCIGRNITYLEQTIALASLVHRYDFELPSPEWVLLQTEAITCTPSDMPVKIKRRWPQKST